MDNITHSLVGFTLYQALTKKNSPGQKELLWTSLIGSNLPDIDVLFRIFTVNGNLGALLHHRGYTHTLLLSFPLAILATTLGSILSGSHLKISLAQKYPSFFIGWVAVMLHLAFDYCNNYGIHPFFPFSNKWFYGDSLFIVEPLFWFMFLPSVFFISQSKWAKFFSLGFCLITLGTLWNTQICTLPITAFLTVWALIFFAFSYQFKNVYPSIVGSAFVLIIFFFGSLLVQKRIKMAIRPLQIAMAPSPSNPFCWSVLALTIEKQTEYVIRTGTLSLWPSMFNSRNCYIQLPNHSSSLLSLNPVSDNNSGPYLFWKGEFRRPLVEGVSLEKNYCQFYAFLRFARLPFWIKPKDTWIVGDLRYDNEKNLGFSKIELSSNQECPKFLPPWTPPTQGIFND